SATSARQIPLIGSLHRLDKAQEFRRIQGGFAPIGYIRRYWLCSAVSKKPSGKEIHSMADAHRESERKGVSSFKAGTGEEMEQLGVTINPAMGGIVKVEKIDKAGKHEELSEEECGRLIGEDEVEEILAALDEAFEAAVISVIGDGDPAGGKYEDDEEKAIRRF